MSRLVIREEAEREVFEAALQYERARPRLGERFASELNDIFERIEENPRQFQVLERGVRRALLRTFPYSVFFEVEGDVVTIFAVLHQRRHPNSWKARL